MLCVKWRTSRYQKSVYIETDMRCWYGMFVLPVNIYYCIFAQLRKWSLTLDVCLTNYSVSYNMSVKKWTHIPRGRSRHVQHVWPNRGPCKKGAPEARECGTAHVTFCGLWDFFLGCCKLCKSSLGAALYSLVWGGSLYAMSANLCEAMHVFPEQDLIGFKSCRAYALHEYNEIHIVII